MLLTSPAGITFAETHEFFFHLWALFPLQWNLDETKALEAYLWLLLLMWDLSVNLRTQILHMTLTDPVKLCQAGRKTNWWGLSSPVNTVYYRKTFSISKIRISTLFSGRKENKKQFLGHTGPLHTPFYCVWILGTSNEITLSFMKRILRNGNATLWFMWFRYKGFVRSF